MRYNKIKFPIGGTKMKNIKTTLFKLYLYCSTAWTMAMCGIVPAFADGDEGDEPAVPDVFDAGGSLVDNLILKISVFYTGKLFILLLLVNLFLLAFTKNEKKIELYKKSLITICVVYALFKCYNLFITSIDSFLQGAGFM